MTNLKNLISFDDFINEQYINETISFVPPRTFESDLKKLGFDSDLISKIFRYVEKYMIGQELWEDFMENIGLSVKDQSKTTKDKRQKLAKYLKNLNDNNSLIEAKDGIVKTQDELNKKLKDAEKERDLIKALRDDSWNFIMNSSEEDLLKLFPILQKELNTKYKGKIDKYRKGLINDISKGFMEIR